MRGLEWLETHPVVCCDGPCTACTKEEVDEAYAAAQAAQKQWAKTPLWQRAELLHKAAALLKGQAALIAECLVKVGRSGREQGWVSSVGSCA